MTKEMLEGLVDNEIITHEQLLKIEKYIIDNQKTEIGKMSQKRAADENTADYLYVKVKKTVSNAKVSNTALSFS